MTCDSAYEKYAAPNLSTLSRTKQLTANNVSLDPTRIIMLRMEFPSGPSALPWMAVWVYFVSCASAPEME